MSLFRSSSVPRLVAAVAVLALGACSKTGTAPTEFGVNVTVDATTLDPSLRSAISHATLTVTQTGADPVVRMPADLPAAIKSGTARFHYKPGPNVIAGNTLTFTLDVSDGTKSIANAQSSVSLAATAVPLVLTLGKGKGNGATCTSDSECGTGFCTDGVCCNERCDDVCVSCDQPDSKGTCKEHAVDTDPEMECAAKIPMVTDTSDAGSGADGATGETDAGAVEADASNAEDAGAADGSSSDGGSMDASESDAYVFNTPDGGLMTMPKACGGACSGARSCKYPDKTKSCGQSYCNTRRDVVSFACNGNGGCEPAVSMCSDFACNDSSGDCRTSCSAHIECQLGDYCNGNNQCVQRKTEGLTCGTDAECRSGHCAIPAGGTSGVCCNTKCDAPFSCNDSGSVGQCKCPGVMCAAGVACQVFYQDADHDGFGNATGTILAGTAQAGCVGAPPKDFVADATDCDDGDANAHPGQTGFFGAPSLGKGLYDYNCDGANQKETPEYPNGTCKFCNGDSTMCKVTSTTCTATSQTASFQCPQEGAVLTIAQSEPVSDLPDLSRVTPSSGAASAGGAGVISYASIGNTPIPGPICRTCFLQCCGCAPNDKTGFLQAVDCGDSTKSVYTCGSCAAVPGTAAMTHTPKQQRCH